jgi:hypothetical protein
MAHLTPTSSFTHAEWSRLAIYKIAVAAGLYTDTVPESPAYRFTAHELARLMVYKQAIVAGFYTDQLSEPSQER